MGKELPKSIVSETPGNLSKKLISLLWVLVLIGVFSFLVGIFKVAPQRAWQTFLINFLFWSGISLAGVIFAAILQITNARWGRPIKRLSEGMGFFLPISFILFFFIFLGKDYIFPWVSSPVPGKEKWLNIPFLFLRDTISLIILYGLSIAFLYFSIKPDIIFIQNREKSNGIREKDYYRILTIITPVILIAYAVIFSLIAFDLVMSLDPNWYSTLFGAYFFIGNLYIGLASIAIISILIRRYLRLEEYIDINLLHDLGNLIFAFCLVTGDFFWSQFLVIWYGNLPEESGFVILRGMESPWSYLSWTVLIICFILPFLIMLIRKVKRNPKTLFALCILILIGMWIERYMLVVPSLWKDKTVPFGFMEVFITLGFFAGFSLTYLFFIRKFPIFPISDPFFK